MFYTWDKIKEVSREIRRIPFEGISEEVRGWNWNTPPLASTYNVKLAVSDIVTGYCDTGRNVYLKYVEHVREEWNPILGRGSLIHKIHEEAISCAKKLIYILEKLSGEIFHRRFVEEKEKFIERISNRYEENFLKENLWIVDKLWSMAALTFSAQLENTLSRSRYLSRETIVSLTAPETAEFPIDGTLIGLTPTIRIDSYLPPGILVELKTRPYKPEYQLTLAGYALAFESMYETPIDHGILLQINIDEKSKSIRFYPKIITLGDDIRTEFIERRDRYAEIVVNEEDPGMPDECSPACPYQYYCKPKKVSRRP